MFQIDPSIKPVVIKVLKENLYLQDGEKLLIATDYPSVLDLKLKEKEILQRIYKRNFLARFIEKVAKKEFPGVKTDLLVYPCPWIHYPETVDDLTEQMAKYDVCFILSEFSVYNITRANTKNKEIITRYAFSSGCDETIFRPQGPLDIDSAKLESEVMQTYVKIKQGKELKLWNHMGTDIKIDLSNKDTRYMYETGIVDYPLKRTNLPAGEITILNPEITGTYIVPAGWIERLDSNLVIKIEKSQIVDIFQQGKDNWLKTNYFLKKYPSKVSFMSIGLNTNATNPFFVIEMIKMRGLASLTIVNQGLRESDAINTRIFSGHCPSPNVYLEVDGTQIFQNGKFMLK